ncbi:UNVERIFIED_CONTAM: hypothetical protein FKN15_066029 [Acipenser sinensis]
MPAQETSSNSSGELKISGCPLIPHQANGLFTPSTFKQMLASYQPLEDTCSVEVSVALSGIKKSLPISPVESPENLHSPDSMTHPAL